MQEYLSADFSVTFSERLLESISRGLLFWQGEKRLALNKISRTRQRISFILGCV